MVMKDDVQTCLVCKSVRTPNKGPNGKPLCTSCSISAYIDKISKGDIIELRIDMTRVRKSTLAKIREMIERDYQMF